MTITTLARHYDKLTSEERFRLILAASGRGDEAERERLMNAGHRIRASMPDHFPYAHAFHEVALMTFIELIEDAALYRDALGLNRDALENEGAGEETCDEADKELDPRLEQDEPEESDEEMPGWLFDLHLAYAQGFVLRTKADGWTLFCKKLTVPPFLIWQELSGFNRLKRSLAVARRAALALDGFLRFLNSIRPAGTAEVTESPLTAKRFASQTRRLFRRRVKRWGG